ncbi:hypothetical protein QBC36DRAFT_7257 [Triangularia setosa]|uniref:Uncharacterized protein n=1 Tax=Triangularia setosa TaxID=2587417 RepID=A0AAN6W9K9_9PEZI|nr:hypothetical protein QBC36DRAFT_7257 [Podospora setosa]
MSCIARSGVFDAKVLTFRLPAPTLTGINKIIRTTKSLHSMQPPTIRGDPPAVYVVSKSHSFQAARPRPLSVSSLSKPSLIPSIVAVNTVAKPSSRPKPAKNNARHRTPPVNSPGSRIPTTPTAPKPSAAQYGRGAIPSTKAPVPPRATTSRTETRRQSLSGIPVALGSPTTLSSPTAPKAQTFSRPVSLLGAPSSGLRTWQTGPNMPFPVPTPTPPKTKRLSAPHGTRGVGPTSKFGTSTNGNLPPTRSLTPRQAVKTSMTQSMISVRSLVPDRVKPLNTQVTASSKSSTIQATSRHFGTMSAKHLVVQEASNRLAKQTATTVSMRASGKIPAKQPTPTTPSRRTATQEITTRSERASVVSLPTRIPTKLATSQPTAALSGRLFARQERTQDTRRVKDSARGCLPNHPASCPNFRNLSRVQGNQLQTQISASNQSAQAKLPITPVSATSTVSPKPTFPLTPVPSKGVFHPPVTPAATTNLSKPSPTPASPTVPKKVPMTASIVTTLSTLPPAPVSKTYPRKSPGTSASPIIALPRNLSSPQCLDENSKISSGPKEFPTTRVIPQQSLFTGAEKQEPQTPQPKQSKCKTTQPNPDVQAKSPPDLRECQNTPTVRAPCNTHEIDATDTPAVPFSPLANGGLFISGEERRIHRQKALKRSKSVGYAPPVRILRSLERAPVPLEYPPWDRTVEVTWERTLNNPPDKLVFEKELSFQQGVLRLREERALRDPEGTHDVNRKGRQSGKHHHLKSLETSKRCLYFFLPDRARFEVTNMILNDLNTGNQNPKPVRMNPPPYYEPIWPLHPLEGRKLWTTEYLDSFSSAIFPLYPYMSVCYDMRVDFLAAFFLARRFHIVYSPFVAGKNCPAATFLMDAYLPLMRYLMLEVDYTKLGGNVHPSAVGVDQWRGLERVRQLVTRFANLQCTRADGANIGNLCLMVRRYYGFREGMRWKKGSAERRARHDESEHEEEPDGDLDSGTELGEKIEDGENDESDNEEPVPYHPDAYLCILDPLKMIGHRIDSLTVVGTTRSYANELIYAVWGKDEIPRGPGWKAKIEKHRKYRTAAIFPFTPGQRSALTRSGGLQVTRHMRDPRGWVGSYGCSLRPEVKIVESELVLGKTKYGFHWNEELGSGPPGSVVTIIKVPSDKHLPNVVMKPTESHQHSSSVTLSRAFNRTPKFIRPASSALSSPLLHTTSASATAPASGLVSPPITKPSPLSQIAFLEEESSDEGQQKSHQSSPNPEARYMEEDGDDHWRRHSWKPSKIPVGSLIKKHAKSIRKKMSTNRLSEAGLEQDSHSDAGSEDQKGTFRKLLKRASSNVLRKSFFGKKGTQTEQ